MAIDQVEYCGACEHYQTCDKCNCRWNAADGDLMHQNHSSENMSSAKLQSDRDDDLHVLNI